MVVLIIICIYSFSVAAMLTIKNLSNTEYYIDPYYNNRKERRQFVIAVIHSVVFLSTLIFILH